MLDTKTQPFHGLTLDSNIFILNERWKQQVACLRTEFWRIFCSRGFLHQKEFCSTGGMKEAFFCFGVSKILFLLKPVTVLFWTSAHSKVEPWVRGMIEWNVEHLFWISKTTLFFLPLYLDTFNFFPPRELEKCTVLRKLNLHWNLGVNS